MNNSGSWNNNNRNNNSLITLYEELVNRTYEVCASYVFVVLKPKPREVFAARYRDRIVHHPRKRYLQHCYNGYKMVGGVVKPFRLYVSNTIKERLYNNLDSREKIISGLGLMKHFKTYNLKIVMFFICNLY